MGSAAFWDKIAPKYAASPMRDRSSYEHKLRLTQAIFEPQHKILEFGCGTGSTALEHAPYVARIDALDISPKMIAIAQEKADASGADNVHFRVGAIEDFAAEADCYDGALALNILHLVDDLDRTLACLSKSIKPGGYLVSSTVCLKRGWFVLLRPFLPVARWLGLVPRVVFLSDQDVIDAYARAGFDVAQDWRHGKDRILFLIGRKGL